LKITRTSIDDCILFTSKKYIDERGFFAETFRENIFKKRLGENIKFVQENISYSNRNVLRGLHIQLQNQQGKLIRVVKGKIFDVGVDLRKNSSTFGKSISVELSDECATQFWLPPGFAHGFCVLSDFAVVEYKCTEYYDSENEITLMWNDPILQIDWPNQNFIISQKDNEGMTLKDLKKILL